MSAIVQVKRKNTTIADLGGTALNTGTN